MRFPIIKICGMREPDNIRRAEQLGPDRMGFVCWEKSPRYVGRTPDYLPESCSRVGVFVNPSLGQVEEDIARLGLDTVQLHGNETPRFCREIKRLVCPNGHAPEIIKAFGTGAGHGLPDTSGYGTVCDFFLFDTRCATMGGSGRTFDWKLLDSYRGERPFLLSGGIGEEHVEALKAFSHPMCAGIDLNSRFESAPGMKDIERLDRFIRQIRKP